MINILYTTGLMFTSDIIVLFLYDIRNVSQKDPKRSCLNILLVFFVVLFWNALVASENVTISKKKIFPGKESLTLPSHLPTTEKSLQISSTMKKRDFQMLESTIGQNSSKYASNVSSATYGINCYLVKHLRFVTTLGKKIPLYVEIVALIMAVIGILGNITTVITILVNFKLRKPYFFALLSLAISDLLALVLTSLILFYEFEMFVYMRCIKTAFIFNIAIMIYIEMNAVLNIILLAIVKFLLMVYPIKSQTILTIKTVLILCPTLLVASLGYGLSIAFILMYLSKSPEGQLYQLFIQAFNTLLPVLIIISLHIITVFKLGNSRAIQKEKKTMNSIVTCILIIFLFYNLLKRANSFTRDVMISQILHITITIAGLFNHASNPFISQPLPRLFKSLGKDSSKGVKEIKSKTLFTPFPFNIEGNLLCYCT